MKKTSNKRRLAAAICLLVTLVLALGMVGCGRTVDTDEYPGEPPSEGKTAFWTEFTPEEWQTLLNEKVIPYVVATLTALSALYLAVSPILVKVKSASEAFEKSSGELKDTNEAAAKDAKLSKARYIKMQKSMEDAVTNMATLVSEAMAEMQAVKDQIAQQNNTMMEEVHKVYEMENDILRMGKLGFGERTDLVKKGIAAQIAQIGGEVKHDDPQT